MGLLDIMTTYIDPYMTVMMTVREMYVSVMVVHHSLQNMTMMMTVGIIKKKCCCHNYLAVTFNDTAPCTMEV